MRGGIHQSNKPTWPFRGKLSMTYDNRKSERDPAVNADKDTQRAETCGYHTTVEPWVEGRVSGSVPRADPEQLLSRA